MLRTLILHNNNVRKLLTNWKKMSNKLKKLLLVLNGFVNYFEYDSIFIHFLKYRLRKKFKAVNVFDNLEKS